MVWEAGRAYKKVVPSEMGDGIEGSSGQAGGFLPR